MTRVSETKYGRKPVECKNLKKAKIGEIIIWKHIEFIMIVTQTIII